MGEKVMFKLKAVISKYRERIAVSLQVLICIIFAGKIIDKEVRERLRLKEKTAKLDAKKSEKLKKIAMRDARRLARAEYKIKKEKLKAREKRNSAINKIIMRKIKSKLKKSR